MFRSGWILILASFLSSTTSATDFDYATFLGTDFASVCDRTLTIVKPPSVDERLSAYVRRSSTLPNESEFHLNLTLGHTGTQIHHVLFPPNQTSEVNLMALLRLGLSLHLVKGQLALMAGAEVIHLESLREPLTEVRVVRDGARVGYITLVGWTGSTHLRFEHGRITPVDHLPFEVPTGPVAVPARDGADPALEVARLAEYAHQPDHESLVLEAIGELSEQVVARAEAVCRGDHAPGGLSGGTYPNVLLALGAYALAGDLGLRAMIADAINEHARDGMRVRWTFEDGLHGLSGNSRVFEISFPGCPTRTFSVPADPFREAAGWGLLQ